MEDDDYQKILDIVTKEESNTVLHTSVQDINKRKEDLLNELQLPVSDVKQLLQKLKHYRYVMELPDLELGSYIRWINLNHGESIYLTNGSFIADIMIMKDGIQIRCKNRFGKIHQLKFDEHLIFQKLSDQEHILLQLVDCVKKNRIKC